MFDKLRSRFARWIYPEQNLMLTLTRNRADAAERALSTWMKATHAENERDQLREALRKIRDTSCDYQLVAGRALANDWPQQTEHRATIAVEPEQKAGVTWCVTRDSRPIFCALSYERAEELAAQIARGEINLDEIDQFQ